MAAAPRFSVAPMVGVTTREHRFLSRQLSRHATLYSEMTVDGVLAFGKERTVSELLDAGADGPVVLQIGSSSADRMRAACRTVDEFSARDPRHGFGEINLNCGCPAKSATSGAHGLSLMKRPGEAAGIVRAACEVTGLPVTVKCRTGVDDRDSYEHLVEFVQGVVDAGARRVIVHARKGWLDGLSARQNRTVPPLDYAVVDRLIDDFPSIDFELNGGISTLEDARTHLARNPRLSGVMVGRALWRSPIFLAGVDRLFFDDPPAEEPSRMGVLEGYAARFAPDIAAADPQRRKRVANAVLEPVFHLFSHTFFSKRYKEVVNGARGAERPFDSLFSYLRSDPEVLKLAEAPIAETPPFAEWGHVDRYWEMDVVDEEPDDCSAATAPRKEGRGRVMDGVMEDLARPDVVKVYAG
ncbi:tRNA-dihydrouridine synthase A [Hyaloraphidium curvatum]|nr:tRNA-dihydrouridine synthase A [Hyaloraphidium curvatum]